ncbi:MAG TPA: mechanosensitive ion channel [Gammaproteobacteria bacterium]
MDFVVESLRMDWEAFLRFAPRLAYAAILLVVALSAAKIAGRSAARLLERSERLRANKQLLRHLISWVIGSVGVLLALGVMGFHGVAASLLATGGVVAIVLGFAFREIGENFLAGFFLTFSRPFELGDLVKTGELTGIVKSIELRYVHVRTFDACDVFVPSAQIFRDPLFNYTRDGLRRPGFTVGVAYNDDPAEVIELLKRAALDIPDVLDDPRPFVTVKEFAAQYIEYEVFFWLDVDNSERGFIDTRNDVKISCWRALRDAGMTFSTDVSAGLDIRSAPPLEIAVVDRNS